MQLLAASDFLDVNGLLDLACKQLGTVLDACTIEEIRTRIHILDDIPANDARALDADDEWVGRMGDEGAEDSAGRVVVACGERN
jgi:hypothetical protein